MVSAPFVGVVQTLFRDDEACPDSEGAGYGECKTYVFVGDHACD